MNQSTSDTRNEQVVVDEELNGVFQGLFTFNEHLVEFFGLSNVTRESIEDESKRAIQERGREEK